MRLHPDAAAILATVAAAGIPPWHTLPPAEGREVYRRRAALFEGSKLAVGQRVGHDDPVRRRAARHPRLPSRRSSRDRSSSTSTAAAGRSATSTVMTRCAGGSRSRPTASWSRSTTGWRPSTRTRRLWTTRSRRSVGSPTTAPSSAATPDPARPRRRQRGRDAHRGGRRSGSATRAARGSPSRCSSTRPPRHRSRCCRSTRTRVGYFLTTADVVWFWRQLPGRRSGDRSRPVCLSRPRPTDLRDLPPAVVITGDFDPLRDDGDIYAHKLRAAGVPVVARRFPGMIHGFVALPVEIPAGRRAIEMIARATRRAWAPAGW